MNLDTIQKNLKERLKDRRYIHSLEVQKVAVALAKHYNISIDKASVAGLVHDCAKDLTDRELLDYALHFNILLPCITKGNIQLIHGWVGAELAKEEFGIVDEEILNAIRFHTTGKENMAILEKIVYLADYIEPNRNFDGVEELREAAFLDMDKALLMAFDHTIRYVIAKGELLHPATITGRNFLILQDQEQEEQNEKFS